MWVFPVSVHLVFKEKREKRGVLWLRKPSNGPVSIVALSIPPLVERQARTVFRALPADTINLSVPCMAEWEAKAIVVELVKSEIIGRAISSLIAYSTCQVLPHCRGGVLPW